MRNILKWYKSCNIYIYLRRDGKNLETSIVYHTIYLGRLCQNTL